MGLSGYGLSHSDIGGYTTLNVILTRSEELLLRWAEYSVFTPLMRTHEGKYITNRTPCVFHIYLRIYRLLNIFIETFLGNKPELNHQVYSTNETLKSFARLTAIYTSLLPYHKDVISQVSLGIPAMAPLFLHYPEDLDSFEVQYEYLYGSDLLVAPVLEPNVVSKTANFISLFFNYFFPPQIFQVYPRSLLTCGPLDSPLGYKSRNFTRTDDNRS